MIVVMMFWLYHISIDGPHAAPVAYWIICIIAHGGSFVSAGPPMSVPVHSLQPLTATIKLHIYLLFNIIIHLI